VDRPDKVVHKTKPLAQTNASMRVSEPDDKRSKPKKSIKYYSCSKGLVIKEDARSDTKDVEMCRKNLMKFRKRRLFHVDICGLYILSECAKASA
jgi:hypothetical protein